MILNKRLMVLFNVVHFEIKQHVNEYMAAHGFDLTPEQFLLIDSLWDKTDGVSQQEAADTIMKDKNSVTRIVDVLEKKGYIKRYKEEGDRRVNKISLTKKAMDISQRVQEVAEEAIEQIVKGLDESQLEEAVQTMLTIHGNIERIRKGKAHKIKLE